MLILAGSILLSTSEAFNLLLSSIIVIGSLFTIAAMLELLREKAVVELKAKQQTNRKTFIIFITY
ncbi:hypothetical protein midi_00591 [Candidatus Midichloria mitochondrii IricVA]|uniref:Uncharacterized protein n=1 Tax=Midichloria mitochondrii (strain IricVA) TaxID=696127 RepID=F7XW42_MIDMI|nr:hypothetical protein midi_00591 [Candidatus Midichloria mitochondrii IricVA]